MFRIWASSPKDVYIVGVGGNNGSSEMWHFDGSKWQEIKLHQSEGGPVIGFITISDIYGFNKNDIWAVGFHTDYNPIIDSNFTYRSLILHFNGNSWSEETQIFGGLQCIGGISSNELWAGGWGGEIIHYNGRSWIKDTASYHFSLRQFTSFLNISAGNSSTIYALASSDNSRYLFQRTINVWELIDSVESTNHILSKIWLSPSLILYGCGIGVNQWTRSSWMTLHPSSNYNSFYYLFGTGDNNIFAVGHSGTVAHFNGSDWYDYPNFLKRDEYFATGWTDGREVIILGCNNNLNTLIFHGK